MSDSEIKYDPTHYSFLKSCVNKDFEFNFKKWNHFVKRLRKNGEYIDLRGAHIPFGLTGADFSDANLSDTHLTGELLNVTFYRTNLSGATVLDSDCSNSSFNSCNLSQAFFADTLFFNTVFNGATFDNTKIYECAFNKETDTRACILSNLMCLEGTKQTLEYINRRLAWIDWYKKHKFLKWIAEPFWCCSDYGRSITRVINVFLLLSFLFSLIYFFCPGVLEGLIPLDRSGNEISLSWWMILTRSFYFSIVTMTTLGFGDISAKPTYFWGHILLMTQVIIGYGLLGALVTCLSVMFTSDGPSQPLYEELYPWYKKAIDKIEDASISVKMSLWSFFFIIYVIAVVVFF